MRWCWIFSKIHFLVHLILMTAIGGRRRPDIISCPVSWGKRSCPRDATAIHYVAVGRNTQPSNWDAEILALIYGRLTSLFGEGKKVSLCTLCNPTGVSRVACGNPSPLTQCRRIRRYFRSECCTGGRPIATLRVSFPLHPSADFKHVAAQATSRVFQVLCKSLCWVCNFDA